LNPVRAKMVARPEDYEYSGHRAYLGLDSSGLVDAEPVLRHFGANKRKAVEVYTRFVNAALGQESQSEYYLAAEGRMLGNDEFLDEIKHRIGDYVLSREKRVRKADMEGIVKAAEKATGLERKDFCSNSKNRQLVLVKEAIIVIGRENGIQTREIAAVLGLDPSAVSKRREAARVRSKGSAQMTKLLKAIRSGAR
jgi:putative transposase